MPDLHGATPSEDLAAAWLGWLLLEVLAAVAAVVATAALAWLVLTMDPLALPVAGGLAWAVLAWWVGRFWRRAEEAR